ncbi:hypothetical protein GCM10022262_27500 [Georgenia daeguensis]|uniref:Uncharacterized protein n=1 Tax=Georgenia daeguensis TaxID=908355 RepID=A0ABP8EWK8_9MICO
MLGGAAASSMFAPAHEMLRTARTARERRLGAVGLEMTVVRAPPGNGGSARRLGLASGRRSGGRLAVRGGVLVV